MPKPQWRCLDTYLWRRDSFTHGSQICSGRWLSVRGYLYKGGVYSSVLHWMKILLVCANLHGSNLHWIRCFCTPVLSSSPPVYLKIPDKWFSSIAACTHALVELVLGSNPTGSVSLEKGALHVASFIPVEIGGLLSDVSLKPSPLTTGCCIWRAAEYPCSFAHLLQQWSLLLRQQDPCREYFFTQGLLILFLLVG